MNQEKIGKFIAECRKNKKLTQSDIAEKLGVSDRTVGNWENGRNMPDLSLFKPLCDELDITINELLSGEKLPKEKYQEKFEENIINTIDYSTNKINIIKNNLGLILLVIGIFISITALTMFESSSSWGSIYSVIGCMISSVGIAKLTRKIPYFKRIIIIIIYLILYLSSLFIIDYISVINQQQMPRFCIEKIWTDQVIECTNPFYNAYLVNRDTPNEYLVVDNSKKYTLDTVPLTPFNREKSGINNIIKYKNKYVGNNSNDGNLINNLPLSEYGYVFEIDSENLGLTIDYHITDWYINENYYLEKSLLYNSVSIFYLIDNVDYIKYNFSGKTYIVYRKDIINNYPNYNKIKNNNTFNKYVENKMNDVDFIDNIFNKIFR
jgi:transcriptional regulator with XRE-family HTH domain